MFVASLALHAVVGIRALVAVVGAGQAKLRGIVSEKGRVALVLACGLRQELPLYTLLTHRVLGPSALLTSRVTLEASTNDSNVVS